MIIYPVPLLVKIFYKHGDNVFQEGRNYSEGGRIHSPIGYLFLWYNLIGNEKNQHLFPKDFTSLTFVETPG